MLLHYYPQSMSSEEDIIGIFQTGSVWLIREPAYRLTDFESDRKASVISVESPSDIIPVAFDDELFRTIRWSAGRSPQIPRLLDSVEEYRLKGASDFKAQNWLSAAVCYTNGLKLDSDSLVMRLNRSEAYIRLGWYHSALADADHALRAGIDDASLLHKAVYRAAKSCYHTGDYQRAIEYAERLQNDKRCNEWIGLAKERIREQETGDYDWCTLYRESSEPRSRSDAADFCGPVEVKEIDSIRGRGLFATRDIKIGELLVGFIFKLIKRQLY